MKIANLLLSGLLVAAMGFMATGCNENDPGTGPGDTNGPGAPRNIQATSLSSSSVGLKWEAPNGVGDTGTITYRVTWTPSTGTSGGNVDVPSGTTTTINNLAANTEYTFSIVSVRSGLQSSAATMKWAGAQRYSQDAGTTTQTIRLYETASNNGSGLTIDPTAGGPRNVSVGASNTTPNSVQLALYTTAGDPNNFEIGPAYAFTEYKNADKFDRNTFISDSTYLAQSLDTWYSSGSINEKISANGNIRAFKLPVAETGTLGQGFYVRTGTAGNYHYARVLIRKVGGRLLQGSGSSRYIEVDISYQPTANLAYAKANGYVTPGHTASKVYHP